MDYRVEHNREENRFEININGLLSMVNYKIDDNGNMKFLHTGVPNELRGKGLAAELSKAALEYAKKNSLKVIPLCSYTKAYIERNPQYQELLAD